MGLNRMISQNERRTLNSFSILSGKGISDDVADGAAADDGATCMTLTELLLFQACLPTVWQALLGLHNHLTAFTHTILLLSYKTE